MTRDETVERIHRAGCESETDEECRRVIAQALDDYRESVLVELAERGLLLDTEELL